MTCNFVDLDIYLVFSDFDGVSAPHILWPILGIARIFSVNKVAGRNTPYKWRLQEKKILSDTVKG